MEEFIIYTVLTIFGLCLGSFAGASVWRLRARQLEQDKKCGEKVNQNDYKRLHKLLKTPLLVDRSTCLNCSYKLRWYDLVPLFSWLSLKGKCRKCHKPIGYLEPLIEIGVAVFFVSSYAFWPYDLNSGLEVVRFILWLVSGVGLAILFAYDKMWSLLPDKVSFTIIGVGLVNSVIVVLGAPGSDKLSTVFSIAGAVMVLSGFYWMLYIISRGAWIGFGDIKLGLALALLLADWKLALVALFTANLIGCLIVIPLMLVGKLRRNSHVPFGPLLISGFFIAGLAGDYLINLYLFSLS